MCVFWMKIRSTVNISCLVHLSVNGSYFLVSEYFPIVDRSLCTTVYAGAGIIVATDVACRTMWSSDLMDLWETVIPPGLKTIE